MDVLRRRVERQRAGLEILQDPRKTVGNALGLAARNNAGFGKHLRVNDASRDVLPIEAAVEGKRGVEVVRGGIHDPGGAACPNLSHEITSFRCADFRI